MPDTDDFDLVDVGTPIDLDNCGREPIHIPGSVQPRGALVAVRESDFTILRVSENIAELLGRRPADVLGEQLSAALGDEPAELLRKASASFGDLRERNPHDVVIDVAGTPLRFDAILHRQTGGVLVVELEVAHGPRPFSFPNTYQAVRGAIERLNRALTLAELYDITAYAVRELTGFDRVMVYRYDQEYNGEVVAEAKRDDLNSFLGLHYPASDIPAQARALYEKNWIRLISDVDYVPSPIVPAFDPAPLDLTHATLRSVSPIHLEYLRNMGVGASMSISLLREDKLWGLIACHHYSGPHLPPYGTRAAAEFLGSTLSLRLVDRYEDEQHELQLARQTVLAKLTAATLDESETLIRALLGAPDLLDLIGAGGVAVQLGGEYQTRGAVPDDDVVRRIAGWAQDTGNEVAHTDHLVEGLDDVPIDLAAGVLVLTLPDGQFVAWFRAEALREIDWGGDPHNKAIAVREGDGVRLSPRKSFDRFREVVRGRSTPWTRGEQGDAAQLRRHLVEALYQRTRADLRLAMTLQRSLLPEALPQLPDWDLTAHYEPAEAGRVGGDWYDAFLLRDDRLVLVLGDVAGHGIGAAGTMAQLRNALRAHLFGGAPPHEALARINEFATHLLPDAFATAVVARIELGTGEIEMASAGHPMPFVIAPGVPARPAGLAISPPLGVTDAAYEPGTFHLAPGESVVVFSDGLVERRTEDIDAGLRHLGATLSALDEPDALTVHGIHPGDTDDDVTVIILHRRHLQVVPGYGFTVEA